MEYYNTLNAFYLNALRSSTFYPKLKIELMDYNENVLCEVQQDISLEDAGSISVNYQQGVRRSCSITLTNIDTFYTPTDNSLIWCNTKFKVYTGIVDANKKDTYWFSQGVYVLTNPKVLRSMSKKTVTLNGVDKFGMFGSETNYHELDGTYLIPSGTTLKNVIGDILSLNMGNGNRFDPQQPFIDPTIANLKLPYDIKKSPETFFGEILTELSSVFACDIFYDTEGRLNVIKGNEYFFMNDQTPLWDYYDVLGDYSEGDLEMKFTEVYNVIKVIGVNPASQIYETILKNEDPNSPTRVSLLGEKSKYIESSFCYNQDRTEDFAKYLLRKYSIMQLTINFNSIFIPHLEVNQAITLTDKYYNYSQQKFLIQSLTIPLTTNSQITVEATNTANIPYFEY